MNAKEIMTVMQMQRALIRWAATRALVMLVSLEMERLVLVFLSLLIPDLPLSLSLSLSLSLHP